jgi:hypothetical protein
MHENLPLPPDEPPKPGQPISGEAPGSESKSVPPPPQDLALIPLVNLPQADPVVKTPLATMIWQKYGHVLIAFVLAGVLVGATVIYMSFQKDEDPRYNKVHLPPTQGASTPPAMSPTDASSQARAISKKSPKSASTRKRGSKKSKAKPKPWLSN